MLPRRRARPPRRIPSLECRARKTSTTGALVPGSRAPKAAERRREEGYCVPDRAREAPWRGNPPTAVAYPRIQLTMPYRAMPRAFGHGDSLPAVPPALSPPDPLREEKEFA